MNTFQCSCRALGSGRECLESGEFGSQSQKFYRQAVSLGNVTSPLRLLAASSEKEELEAISQDCCVLVHQRQRGGCCTVLRQQHASSCQVAAGKRAGEGGGRPLGIRMKAPG